MDNNSDWHWEGSVEGFLDVVLWALVYERLGRERPEGWTKIICSSDMTLEKAEEYGITPDTIVGEMERICKGYQDKKKAEEEKKEKQKTMDRIYRVNPFCPYCGEEHCYFNIKLTDEEQKILDDYYENVKGDSSGLAVLLNALDNPPLVVKREFKCGCGKSFEKNVAVFREDELGYSSPDYIGPLGTSPV